MLSIKKKLEEATGVPVVEQKVMLAGLDELMMGDKRTNIKFGKCGTSNTAGSAPTFDPLHPPSPPPALSHPAVPSRRPSSLRKEAGEQRHGGWGAARWTT